MINALGDSIRASANGNSSLCGIRQHLRGNLNRGSGHLSYLLNFWATFADQWATLWGWYYKPEGDGRSGYSCRRNQVCQVLKNLRKNTGYLNYLYRIHLDQNQVFVAFLNFLSKLFTFNTKMWSCYLNFNSLILKPIMRRGGAKVPGER